MATFNYTIKSSGGDYTSLSAFEAALPGSGSDTYIATYDEALSDTTAVTFSGIGASVIVEVTVNPAYRCRGRADGSFAELVNSTSGSSVTLTTSGVQLTVSHLRIVRSDGNISRALLDSSASSALVFKNCLFILRSPTGASTIITVNGGATAYFYGCAFLLEGCTVSGDYAGLASTSVVRLFGCTFLALDCSVGSSSFVRAFATASVDARNCVFVLYNSTMSLGAMYDSGWVAGSNYNATSDMSAKGTNAKTNLKRSLFVSVTPDAEDLRFDGRRAMLEAGVGEDLTAYYTEDINGDFLREAYKGADYVPPVVLTASASFVSSSPNVLLQG